MSLSNFHLCQLGIWKRVGWLTNYHRSSGSYKPIAEYSMESNNIKLGHEKLVAHAQILFSNPGNPEPQNMYNFYLNVQKFPISVGARLGQSMGPILFWLLTKKGTLPQNTLIKTMALSCTSPIITMLEVYAFSPSKGKSESMEN